MKGYATYREKIKLHTTTTFKYIFAMYFRVSIQLIINKLVYVNIYCTICSNVPDITQFKIKIPLRSRNSFKKFYYTTQRQPSNKAVS
jgi:hypothetical protein